MSERRQDVIRHNLKEMSETLREASNIDFSNRRHRQVIVSNLKTIVSQLIDVMISISKEIFETEEAKDETKGFKD
jgi:hypothetical protein